MQYDVTSVRRCCTGVRKKNNCSLLLWTFKIYSLHGIGKKILYFLLKKCRTGWLGDPMDGCKSFLKDRLEKEPNGFVLWNTFFNECKVKWCWPRLLETMLNRKQLKCVCGPLPLTATLIHWAKMDESFHFSLLSTSLNIKAKINFQRRKKNLRHLSLGKMETNSMQKSY